MSKFEKNAISVSREVAAAPSDVWDVLSDGWLYPFWVVGAARMREVDDSWPEKCSRLHHSVGNWPMLLNDKSEVLEAKPLRYLRLRAHGWPAGAAEVLIEIEERGHRLPRSVRTRSRAPERCSRAPRGRQRSCRATGRRCAASPTSSKGAVPTSLRRQLSSRPTPCATTLVSPDHRERRELRSSHTLRARRHPGEPRRWPGRAPRSVSPGDRGRGSGGRRAADGALRCRR